MMYHTTYLAANKNTRNYQEADWQVELPWKA
jgi:hypothetical protein